MAESTLIPHKNSSFSYKVINKRIKEILDTRSTLENNIQVAMPFVRATTTIKLPSAFNMGDGNVGFSLGLHAIDEDLAYEDMYASSENQMPLVGYTFNGNSTRPVYAIDPMANVKANFFDRRTLLYTDVTNNYTRIAPPGITNLTVGRNKNGMFSHAQLTITVPSLIQLETLHRTFLVPNVGMIIEWGQNFAGDLENTDYKMFPWKTALERDSLFKRLALQEIGVEEILNDYAYPSNGQYTWTFGRVANFSITTNIDGSFTCIVKIVGPSETGYAYSVINTAVPAKDATTKLFCAEKTNSIYTYMTNTAVGGFNLKTILDHFKNDTNDESEWKYHVWHVPQGNKKEGSLENNNTSKNNLAVDERPFQEHQDAYFVTWRFFVNVILNSEEYGIKKIFKDASLTEDEITKISLLLPFADGPSRNNGSVGSINKPYIDDPLEPYVGYNKYLRSVDLSTCFLINEEAAKMAEQSEQYKLQVAQKFLQLIPEKDRKYLFSTGEFGRTVNGEFLEDKGLLSSGVWINHKAIVESFVSADTVVRGIKNLLQRMNRATANYWKLTLDAVEPMILSDGRSEPHNFTVVDENYRENVSAAVEEFIDNVHVFNKYIRFDKTTNKLVGSELLECSIDLSLPKLLFSQIATMGLTQPEDKAKYNLITNSTPMETEGLDMGPKIADPNDTLREMFSILVLDPKDDSEQGPDLTILPKTQRKQLTLQNNVCGNANVQVTARAGGNANQASNAEVLNSQNIDEVKKLISDADSELKRFSEQYKSCNDCKDKTVNIDLNGEKYITRIHDVGSTPHPGVRDDSTQYQNGYLPDNKLKSVGGGFKLQTEAADKFNQLVAAYAQNTGKQLTINSAYRSYDEQVRAREEYGSQAAAPGKSAHGWGAAVDIRELYSETQQLQSRLGVGNLTNPRINAMVRSNSDLYNWLATNGPKFGWYNPKRLQASPDSSGTAEAWHWEYWGFKQNLENNPTIATPQLANDTQNSSANQTTNTTSTTTTQASDLDACYTKVGNIAVQKDSMTVGSAAGSSERFSVTFSNNIDKKLETVTDPKERGKIICDYCDQLTLQKTQAQKRLSVLSNASQKANIANREFPNLRNVFRYLEIYREYMVASITGTANGIISNAFGAAPGSLSIGGDIVLPGIAGIRVGELFWIERIPSFYRVFGAFQVLSLEDAVDINGWKTKVHARFNYLGRLWQQTMAKKLLEST